MLESRNIASCPCRIRCSPQAITMHLVTAFLLSLILVAACGGDVYVRDGVTDGDTFFLADRALRDDDPVLQSWVSYSLTLSACQLALGGDNPARDTSFDCELTARRHLLETWNEQRGAGATDPYLDTLRNVHEAGFLAEYVAEHLGRAHWTLPPDLELAGYRQFERRHYPGHRPRTRLIGSWNYARNVYRTP
ncbi:MAG: hypothetical protein U5K76_14140 [Woeseiaceae bacterium]|nr:hypothetical protein [Woeseiaceae bacterium]